MKKGTLTVGALFLLIGLGTSTGILPLGDNGEKLILPQVSGERNPAVKQSTIDKTVCIPNWTDTIRPSVGFTNSLKAYQLDFLDYDDQTLSHYEEDHLIPLGIGGNPTSLKNLWPEPRYQSRISDPIEYKLHRLVCAGKTTLRNAQTVILHYKRTKG